MNEQFSGRPPFEVRATERARRESALGKGLFERPEERAWVLDQLRLLRHWPPGPGAIDDNGFQVDLDVEKIHHAGVEFYEYRLRHAAHRGNTPMRIFILVHDARRTIWVLGGYWKKTRRIEETVKTRMARRAREVLHRLRHEEGDNP